VQACAGTSLRTNSGPNEGRNGPVVVHRPLAPSALLPLSFLPARHQCQRGDRLAWKTNSIVAASAVGT